MKIISLFNNKGGVGKSTLGYHLGCALSELGKKTLLIDLDPQCNLSICGLKPDELEKIWREEDEFIDDFAKAKIKHGINDITNSVRSIHFLLKPAEDGADEIEKYPLPKKLYKNLDLIPGRLSIHKYENKIAERWSGAYQGDNLSIRTITNIRRICEKYGEIHEYDFIIIDTSPSLGILNKDIISTVDGFLIPAQPDMFSLYGIKNIGKSLEEWQREFNTLKHLLSEEKIGKFPKKFVQFIGYTLYNSKKYAASNSKQSNEYNLADAHYSYAKQIPEEIKLYIKEPNRINVGDIYNPIGGTAIIHSHNTFPSVSQALKCPMWEVPNEYDAVKKQQDNNFEHEVNHGSYGRYRETKEKYETFAKDFMKRVEVL